MFDVRHSRKTKEMNSVELCGTRRAVVVFISAPCTFARWSQFVLLIAIVLLLLQTLDVGARSSHRLAVQYRSIAQ